MQHFRNHRQQSHQQKPSVSQVSQPPAPERAHSASSMPGNSHNDHGGSHMQIAEQPKRVSMPKEQHLLSAEQEGSREEAARVATTQGMDSCSCEGPSFDAAEGGMRCHGTDDQVLGKAGVQGFAVATCCHHRCSWQHYIGRPLFKRLKLKPDEFEIISWMTGASVLPSFCSTKITDSHNPIAMLVY